MVEVKGDQIIGDSVILQTISYRGYGEADQKKYSRVLASFRGAETND